MPLWGAASSHRVTDARWPGHSVLVVPAPALEHWVRARTAHYDTAYVSSDPRFAHAHLTLLGPFVAPADLTPGLRAQVAGVLHGHASFTARLETVAVFADGTIHLRPDDEEPFRRLTADLAAAFPDQPPYGGAFEGVRPHLTLDRVGPGVDVERVRAWVAPLLPATVEVTEARLSWYEQGRCHEVARWPLGG